MKKNRIIEAFYDNNAAWRALLLEQIQREIDPLVRNALYEDLMGAG